MRYETFEGDMFFGHRVWLSIKGDRIKELDQHLQTYGRRSIDWEIDSQVHQKRSNRLVDMRKFRSSWWTPGESDYISEDHIRFRTKSDAVRFKLSWDECVAVDQKDDRLLAMFRKIHLNSMYPKWAPFTTRYGILNQGIEPLGWFSKRHGIGINLDGQYELDFDGSIAESRRNSIYAMDLESEWTKEFFPKLKVYKDRTDMTNLCSEVPQPGPASSSDSTSSTSGE